MCDVILLFVFPYGFGFAVSADFVPEFVCRERQGASRRFVQLPDLLMFMPLILAFSPMGEETGNDVVIETGS